MKILVTGAAVIAAALALSVPSLAKEPKEATLCGPDECATLTDRSLLLGVMQDGAAGPPPPPGPYYKLTVSFEAPGHEARFAFWYVPSSPMYRPADTDYPPADWIALRPEAAAAFEVAAEGVEAFPAPKPTGVKIGSRPVDDPSSYLRLFTVQSSGDATPTAGDWKIVTFSGPPSPWTDNLLQLEYSPAADLLQRGSEFVKLSPSLAASVEAGESIALPGSGFPWLYVAIAGVVIALLAAIALAARAARVSRAPGATIDLT